MYIYFLTPVSFSFRVVSLQQTSVGVCLSQTSRGTGSSFDAEGVFFLIACLSFAGVVAASVTAAAAAAAGCLLLLPPPSPISCLLDLLTAFWSLLLIVALPAVCRVFRN